MLLLLWGSSTVCYGYRAAVIAAPAVTRWVTGWVGLPFFAVLVVRLRTERPRAGTTVGPAVGSGMKVSPTVTSPFVVFVPSDDTSPGVKNVAVEGRGYTDFTLLSPGGGPITVMLPRQSGPNGATRTYTEPVVGTSFVRVFSF